MEQKEKKSIFKKWWFWVIAVFAFFAVVGSMGSQNNNVAVQTSTKELPTAQPEQVIKVSASQLSKDYDANEVSADAKYKNKIVEVTGTIKSISKDIMDQPYVLLDSGSSSSITDIQCMFDKSNQAELASLSKDTKITLKGEVSSKLMNVLIRGCSIIK